MRALALLGLLLVGCGEEPSRRTPALASKTAELRPTDTGSALMWRYQAGDVIESLALDGGSFRAHFTRAGVNAVPAGDLDDGGVPDFVEQVADAYEAVGALYHGPLGFRRPLPDGALAPNGGDARFDVYLLDFARSADGAFRVDQCLASSERCIGYVVQENDFSGYGYPSAVAATRILGSHEYFHAVQAAYDHGQDVVVTEATAVWATERFDPSTRDFENFIDGYLNRPERSLDSPPPGPVPDFAYGAAIFFKYLTERHDDALIRKLWERLENGQGDPAEPADQANPTWLVQLDALLRRDYQSSFAAEFAEFARWNLYLGALADPAQAWDDASAWPPVKSSPVTLPYKLDAQRYFYASAQYFSAPAGGRSRVTAALVDSPLTPGNDLEGMVVWLAAQRGGRNVEVVKVSAGETVDASGAAVVAAVVNTRRGAVGTALSQRPVLCLGTPEEVAACVAASGGGAAVDAGAPSPSDAGVTGGEDAGVSTPPPELTPPSGCGCGSAPAPALLLALGLALTGRRRH